MKIAVIGTGYVGLTSGACFAELGHTVICNDIDEAKIDSLNKGICPIFEEGLPELLTKHTKSGNLSFTLSIQEAIKDAEVIFICVGTPPKEDGSPDLTYIENVLKDLQHLDHYAVIVEKSTVPVRTAEWMKKLLTENLKCEFDVSVNPEFLREGTSVHDFLHPDRIVVGTENEKAKEIMTEVYENVKAPIIHTDLNSAEIIKHASNALLATKISYANMVSQLCEKTDADIITVMDGVGADKRIGRQFLYAGLGYGGFCFPKDLEAFVSVLEQYHVDPALLKAVKNINDYQRKHVANIAKEMITDIKGKTIGVFGCAFKPNTDDTRLSPAVFLMQDLQNLGATIRTYDPEAAENAKKVLKDVTFCKDPYEVAEGCDLVILATEWNEFKEMDLTKIKEKVTKFIDARNIFDPKKMRDLGFNYRSLGRQ